jgi:hypothetical protein
MYKHIEECIQKGAVLRLIVERLSNIAIGRLEDTHNSSILHYAEAMEYQRTLSLLEEAVKNNVLKISPTLPWVGINESFGEFDKHLKSSHLFYVYQHGGTLIAKLITTNITLSLGPNRTEPITESFFPQQKICKGIHLAEIIETITKVQYVPINGIF